MIIKVRNKPGFAQIQNETLRDKRLSLETRGALGEILTYSEQFDASVESLMKLWGIGREKLLKITNELKESGYLEIVNVHDKRGRIVDKIWNFYGESQNVNYRKQKEKYVHQDAEKPHDGDVTENEVHHDTGLTYVGENQSSENPHDLILEIKTSQKDELKEKKKGGGGLNPPANGNGKPPAAADSPNNIPKESQEEYLLRKQLEYPNFNVYEIFNEFSVKCRSPQYPNLKPTRQSFDKWLATEHEPLTPAERQNYINPQTGKGLK
ncbi:MAG TPA: hypothetical protein PKY82_22685 [Pyrinomonadaceae bacterium]|nr:hypothetical protein [Pyrinomonadaceae bacterium]